MLNKRILAVITIVIISVMVFFIGYNTGINHAITDSEIYTDNQYIYIEIDNNLYVHNR